jgi:hypothetical protein
MSSAAVPTTSPPGPQPIPRIVKAVAGTSVLVALVLGILAAIALVVFAEEATPAAGFALLVATLASGTGQSLEVSGGAFLLGDIAASLRVIPFGALLLTAAALRWLPFSSAWVAREDLKWRGAGVGLAINAAAVAVAGIASTMADFDADIGYVEIGFSLNLVAIVLLGAGPWLLAHATTRNRIVDRTFQLLCALSALVTVILLLQIAVGFDDNGIAWALFTLPATVGYSLNTVAVMLLLPFFGAIEGNIGSTSQTATFGTMLDESATWWLAPLIALAGFAAVGYLQSVADGWNALLERSKVMAGTLLAVLLPIAVFGDIVVSFDIRALFSSEGDSIVVAAAGLPWRFIPPLIVLTLATTVGGWFAANRAGVEWAQTDRLHEFATAAGHTLRGLGETIRKAASDATAAAQQTSPSSPDQSNAATTGSPDQTAHPTSPLAVTSNDPSATTADAAVEPPPTSQAIQAQLEAEAAALGVADQLPSIAAQVGIASPVDLLDAAKAQEMRIRLQQAASEGSSLRWGTSASTDAEADLPTG